MGPSAVLIWNSRFSEEQLGPSERWESNNSNSHISDAHSNSSSDGETNWTAGEEQGEKDSYLPSAMPLPYGPQSESTTQIWCGPLTLN